MEAAPVYVSTTATAEDLQQLKLLSIFHYVLAGITGLFSLFPLIHLFMGLAIVTGHLPMTTTNADAPEMDPRWFGWFFVVFAAGFIACGLTLAGFMAYAGRCIAQRLSLIHI